MKRAIIFVMDGAADRKIEELGGKTPLEAADKPNMDRIAKEGINAILYTVEPGLIPGSDTAHISLLGYDAKKVYPGRGPLEALGEGIKLQHGDVAFRVNFATVDDQMRIVDRRAGRIQEGTDELASLLDGLEIDGVKVIFKPSTAHRAVLVLRGEGLSDKVSDSDPHKTGVKLPKVRPLEDTPEAKRTANILNKIIQIAHERFEKAKINQERKKKGLPPANIILTRGAGMMKKVEPFSERYHMSGAVIAEVAIVRGVGGLLGMDFFTPPGSTGGPDTDLESIIEFVIEKSKEYEFLLVNVKGTDVLGHDGKWKEKKEFIEKIDEKLKPLIDHCESEGIYFLITADHTTPCSKGDHSSDPVPLAAIGPDVRIDEVEKYGERYCAKGGLGTLIGVELFHVLLDWLDKEEKFGA